MKLRALLLMLGILMFSRTALAEGGCPVGYTPVNNGQNWTCIPGGNDARTQQQPQQSQQPIPRSSFVFDRPREAPNGYAAIALAPNLKGGVAHDAPTLDEAVASAMNTCGTAQCAVVGKWKNECGAVAVGQGRESITFRRAASIDSAAIMAILMCEQTSGGKNQCALYDMPACSGDRYGDGSYRDYQSSVMRMSYEERMAEAKKLSDRVREQIGDENVRESFMELGVADNFKSL